MLQINSKSKRNTINRRIKIRISNGKKKTACQGWFKPIFSKCKNAPKDMQKKLQIITKKTANLKNKSKRKEPSLSNPETHWITILRIIIWQNIAILHDTAFPKEYSNSIMIKNIQYKKKRKAAWFGLFSHSLWRKRRGPCTTHHHTQPEPKSRSFFIFYFIIFCIFAKQKIGQGKPCLPYMN